MRRDCFTPATVKNSLGRADVLKLSLEEAEALSEMFCLGKQSAPEIVSALFARCLISSIVVTNGEHGAYAATRAGEEVYAPGYRVDVVDTLGSGDAFTAGNDMGDFLNNPPGPGNFPQGPVMDALIAFEKPIVAAVQGVAIGSGTTMLTHCDFVYAGESAKFQMPFVNLGLVPEFGSSYSVPARVGHLRAAELFLLGGSFTAARAVELGLATRVVPDKDRLATNHILTAVRSRSSDPSS